jgi:predicted CxxxxCH...CXXCH cytochrome family protein
MKRLLLVFMAIGISAAFFYSCGNDTEYVYVCAEVCDGLDNDANNLIDDNLVAPLNTIQNGVCADSTRKCAGAGGWVDDYSGVEDYEATESLCDSLDNDCDNLTDEGCFSCTDCHGSGVSPAPPPDTSGNSATTNRGVGAHEKHLVGPIWSRKVACTDCHVVPAAVSAPGHNDTPLPAEVTWGALAQTDGAAPSWDGTSCSGVYCHGATLYGGGSNTAPVWTTVDESQAACGTCHGLPPNAPHPATAACEACHSSVAAAGPVIINPDLHINGVTDF